MRTNAYNNMSRVLLGLVLALGVARPVRAEDDVAKAAKAYRQAQQAELGEEFALASDLYELADQLAPSAEALRGATRMALRAERWAVAASNAVELQKRYPTDPKSVELASQTLERTRPLLCELHVDCGDGECNVLVDGKAATLESADDHILFVSAGAHTVAGGYAGGTSEKVSIIAEAGGKTEVELVAPVIKAAPKPEPTAEPTDDRRKSVDEAPPRKRPLGRISPAYFAVGLVATAGLAAGTIVSGLQARKAADDFKSGGYTRALYDDAHAIETRTNILFGVTAAVGITTIVLAVFTDWHRRGKDKAGGKARARITPGPRLAGAGVGIDF